MKPGVETTSPRRFEVHTLGCKVNFAESSARARELEAEGWKRIENGKLKMESELTQASANANEKSLSTSHLIVVNTCSVTAAADKKCRNLIARLHRQHPSAEIVATGCYATRAPREVGALPGVARVESNMDKPLCAESLGERTRSFVKVQDGCDYACSYCTIRSARGASRNPSIAEVVARVRELAAAGVREVVLTGVNTGDFGRSTGETFIDLLRALDATGIDRFRISSIEPNLLTDEVIDFCAARPRWMPHFHIPLQSGCDRILASMRRRYTAARFAERVARVRERMPDAFFGIDVIVGFPGETDEDFEQTFSFLEALKPAELHVFPYSVRPGTPAAEMPGRVSPAVIAARAGRLGLLSESLHVEFRARHLSPAATVLWEGGRKKSRSMSGFTENYIRVDAPWDDAGIGTITPL